MPIGVQYEPFLCRTAISQRRDIQRRRGWCEPYAHGRCHVNKWRIVRIDMQHGLYPFSSQVHALSITAGSTHTANATFRCSRLALSSCMSPLARGTPCSYTATAVPLQRAGRTGQGNLPELEAGAVFVQVYAVSDHTVLLRATACRCSRLDRPRTMQPSGA